MARLQARRSREARAALVARGAWATARDEAGATLVLALVGLLLAVMASAAIVSLALSEARLVAAEAAADQGYLAVSGAAALVRDAVTSTTGASDAGAGAGAATTVAEGATDDEPEASELRALAVRLFREARASAEGVAERTFVLEATGDADADGAAEALGGVNVRLSVDARGLLAIEAARDGRVVRLTVAATGEDDEPRWLAADVVAVVVVGEAVA